MTTTLTRNSSFLSEKFEAYYQESCSNHDAIIRKYKQLLHGSGTPSGGGRTPVLIEGAVQPDEGLSDGSPAAATRRVARPVARPLVPESRRLSSGHVKPPAGLQPCTDQSRLQSKKYLADQRNGIVEHQLSNWCIVISSAKDVILSGNYNYVPDGEEGNRWYSTAIIERLSARVVRTRSGTIYNLLGLYIAGKYDQDLPERMVHHFRNGFPKQWKELVASIVLGKLTSRDILKSGLKSPRSKHSIPQRDRSKTNDTPTSRQLFRNPDLIEALNPPRFQLRTTEADRQCTYRPVSSTSNRPVPSDLVAALNPPPPTIAHRKVTKQQVTRSRRSMFIDVNTVGVAEMTSDCVDEDSATSDDCRKSSRMKGGSQRRKVSGHLVKSTTELVDRSNAKKQPVGRPKKRKVAEIATVVSRRAATLAKKVSAKAVPPPTSLRRSTRVTKKTAFFGLGNSIEETAAPGRTSHSKSVATHKVTPSKTMATRVTKKTALFGLGNSIEETATPGRTSYSKSVTTHKVTPSKTMATRGLTEILSSKSRSPRIQRKNVISPKAESPQVQSTRSQRKTVISPKSRCPMMTVSPKIQPSKSDTQRSSRLQRMKDLSQTVQSPKGHREKVPVLKIHRPGMSSPKNRAASAQSPKAGSSRSPRLRTIAVDPRTGNIASKKSDCKQDVMSAVRSPTVTRNGLRPLTSRSPAGDSDAAGSPSPKRRRARPEESFTGSVSCGNVGGRSDLCASRRSSPKRNVAAGGSPRLIAKLSTASPHQMSAMSFYSSPKGSKSKIVVSAAVEASKEKDVSITAKRGTLKFSRQKRDFLKARATADSDDDCDFLSQENFQSKSLYKGLSKHLRQGLTEQLTDDEDGVRTPRSSGPVPSPVSERKTPNPSPTSSLAFMKPSNKDVVDRFINNRRKDSKRLAAGANGSRPRDSMLIQNSISTPLRPKDATTRWVNQVRTLSSDINSLERVDDGDENDDLYFNSDSE